MALAHTQRHTHTGTRWLVTNNVEKMEMLIMSAPALVAESKGTRKILLSLPLHVQIEVNKLIAVYTRCHRRRRVDEPYSYISLSYTNPTKQSFAIDGRYPFYSFIANAVPFVTFQIDFATFRFFLCFCFCLCSFFISSLPFCSYILCVVHLSLVRKLTHSTYFISLKISLLFWRMHMWQMNKWWLFH